MKKVIFVLVVLSFVFLTTGVILAVTPTTQKTVEDIQKNLARNTLASKEWKIYLIPDGSKTAAETDVLTFTQGTVVSKKLLELGYGESNITLRLEEGLPVWVTMQTNPGVGLAFLRGELRGQVMRGTIGIEPKKGKASHYTFTTEAGWVIPPPAPEPAPVKKTTKK